MGRSNTKMPLELIKSDKSRRVTFGKRKKGLIKKTLELTGLCDVQCGLIIFDEKKPHGQLSLETYPDNHDQLKEVIDRFVSKSAKVRKVENLADYFGKQITQVNKDTAKLRHKNNEARFPSCDERLDDLSLDRLLELSKKLDHKIEDVHRCFANNQNAINDINGHAILPQMGLFSSCNKVEYNQMVGVNQYSSNCGSMMYANDRVLQEEQAADLQMFQNNLLNYDQHYDNGLSWQNYNIEGAPSTTLNGSNCDGSFSNSIMLEDRLQYGNRDNYDDLTPLNHVSLETVYPMSTSFLCGNANPFWNLKG